MDGNWLNLPPDQWAYNGQFQHMSNIVNNLSVVNDAAERGVKDIQDYANAARDGSCREQMVLVSNMHRIRLPNFLKNEMQEKMWKNSAILLNQLSSWSTCEHFVHFHNKGSFIWQSRIKDLISLLLILIAYFLWIPFQDVISQYVDFFFDKVIHFINSFLICSYGLN